MAQLEVTDVYSHNAVDVTQTAAQLQDIIHVHHITYLLLRHQNALVLVPNMADIKQTNVWLCRKTIPSRLSLILN